MRKLKKDSVITAKEAELINSEKVQKEINKIELTERLLKEQLEYQEDIQHSGYNIVTCGHCGSILIHKMKVKNIHCFSCLRNMDTSDCPDLNY